MRGRGKKADEGKEEEERGMNDTVKGKIERREKTQEN